MKNKINEKIEKTKMTNKDLKFQVGDFIYYVSKNEDDYDFKVLSIGMNKVKSITIQEDNIVYNTEREFSLTQTINNDLSNYFKTKEAVLKKFTKEMDIYLDENLTI